jgi:cystathionine beta-lyase
MLGLAPDDLNHFMLTKARLWLDRGTKFGVEGASFMRMNLGCPRATVSEAVRRLGNALS